MRIEPYFVIPEKFDVNIQNLNESKTKKNCNCKCKCLEVLAEPKCSNEQCLKSKVSKPITQIIDKTDGRENSRTEQLALPLARQISELRKRPAFKNFEQERKSQVNRIYRRTLLSLYSRLANVKPEKEPEPPPPELDRDTQKKMMRRIRKLSKPKKDFSKEVPKARPKPKGPYKPFANGRQPNQKRLAMLSKPKKYTEMEINQWCLTKAMKYYKPTERLLNLSKPKTYVNKDFEMIKVSPEALTYKATTRIKNLATPTKFYTKALQEETFDPFKINPKALKATSTKRVRELAKPKDYDEPPVNLDPYHVSKAALKAKITPRLKALAQPKKYKT